MTNSSKNILSTEANPYRNKNYTVSLLQEITLNEQTFQFGLRYVPDKLLLNHEALVDYLTHILKQTSLKTEILAHDILEDIMDQIIPKWIEVNLKQQPNIFGQTILITIEDRQPGWDEPLHLQRLPTIF
ncbi:MAG: hypothetical protein JKY45_14265 [Emcibacter sp.]|nr:hypothetical protein [Emcibacter sp.]